MHLKNIKFPYSLQSSQKNVKIISTWKNCDGRVKIKIIEVKTRKAPGRDES